MKLIYKEEFDLSLKAVFLLKIFFRLPNNQMDYSMHYDWMHNIYKLGAFPWIGDGVDEYKSTAKAFHELIDGGLIEYPEVGCNSYIKAILSKKGKYFKNKVKRIDTKEFDDLIPERFFK